jgi:hypothetical protein
MFTEFAIAAERPIDGDSRAVSCSGSNLTLAVLATPNLSTNVRLSGSVGTHVDFFSCSFRRFFTSGPQQLSLRLVQIQLIKL